MHERTQIKLKAADRADLQAIVANCYSLHKHVWRAKIVLLTADGHGTAEIMRRTGKATLPISTPRCWNGLRAIPAMSSTSPPPRRPGSMPSKGYSHYSLSGASARRFSFRLEIQGCYPQLHCRHERKFKTVYLDKRPRQDHCSRPTKVTNC
jgi:hypothetical protein